MTNSAPGKRGMMIGATLRRTFLQMTTRVERLFTDQSLTLAQWITLKAIRDGDAACIGQVAAELGYNSGAASRLVDQLEQRALIRRARNKIGADRRVVRLELTPHGRQLADDMERRLLPFWDDTLSVFSPQEQSNILDLLARLGQRFRNDEL